MREQLYKRTTINHLPLKKNIFLLSVVLSIIVKAQYKDSPVRKSTYIKVNSVFLPIGMLNAGIETQLSNKYTFQSDVFISPWKFFMKHEFQIYMIGFEGRYYFKEAFRHWYVGANVSAARFILQKWDYWSHEPYQFKEGDPIYIKSDLYQSGFSFIFGASTGYQFKINENWNIDLYLGIGSSQDFYKGYHRNLGVRYDDPSRKWNRSGEWIPYRGGVMISYKLK